VTLDSNTAVGIFWGDEARPRKHMDAVVFLSFIQLILFDYHNGLKGKNT